MNGWNLQFVLERRNLYILKIFKYKTIVFFTVTLRYHCIHAMDFEWWPLPTISIRTISTVS